MSEFCRKGAVTAFAIALVLLASPMQSFASGHTQLDDNVNLTKLSTASEAEQQEEIEPEVIDTHIEDAEEAEEQKVSEASEVKEEIIEEKKTVVAEQDEKPVLENTVAKPAAKSVSGNRAAIINSSQLNPQDPKSKDLDLFVDDLLDGLITEEMSTYEQTKAVYDYIVANTSYGSHVAYLGTPINSVTARDIYSQYGEIEGYGAVVLGSKTGMCNAYSAAFIVLAREIGLDAYLVRGSTQSAWGGYTYHEWAEVRIGDTVYMFDPQLEQDLTRAGLGTYNVFCKTYDQVPGRYVKSSGPVYA